MHRHGLIVFIVMVLALAACSDDGSTSDESPVGDTVSTTTDDPVSDAPSEDEVANAAQETADEIAEDLESQQAAQGGGSAILVVGDQQWTFDAVLCAFGEDEIGQAGAEFVLSSIQGGLQMYVSIDSFGHSVSLNDIEDFENPSVALSWFGDSGINVDGKQVAAEVEMDDETSDSFETITGTFTATCP